MSINREHLAPCPFCGGAVQFHSDEDCPGCHYIECGGCKAMFDFSPTADPENQCDSLHELQCGIAHVWNTRAQAAPEAEPVAWVQEVPDHCDRITWRGCYYHLPIDGAQQHDAELVELLGQIADYMARHVCKAPSGKTATRLHGELIAKLASLRRGEK